MSLFCGMVQKLLFFNYKVTQCVSQYLYNIDTRNAFNNRASNNSAMCFQTFYWVLLSWKQCFHKSRASMNHIHYAFSKNCIVVWMTVKFQKPFETSCQRLFFQTHLVCLKYLWYSIIDTTSAGTHVSHLVSLYIHCPFYQD